MCPGVHCICDRVFKVIIGSADGLVPSGSKLSSVPMLTRVYDGKWHHEVMTIKIGSGNGLVPSGSKPLPVPMLTRVYDGKWNHDNQDWFRKWLGAIRQQAIACTNADHDLWHHMLSLSHNELTCSVIFKLAPLKVSLQYFLMPCYLLQLI